MGENRTLSAKLNKHFAAIGAAGAAITGLGLVEQAQAAIVYSGTVNYDIPATIDGLYLNVATNTTGPTGPATAGWDINPYNATGLQYFATSANASPANRGYVADGSAAGPASNLADGTPIGAGNIYNTGIAAGTNFPAAGPGGVFGFRFFNEGTAAVNYGWARIARPGPNGFGRIVDFAFENTGASLPSGIVPEPASLGMLALGALGLAARRRA